MPISLVILNESSESLHSVSVVVCLYSAAVWKMLYGTASDVP
jgi:hypothetical protein